MSIDRLEAGDLQIDVVDVEEPPTTRLHWLGKSNEQQPDEILRPFFAKVLEVATRDAKALEMHFEKLDHFNSSTIMSIVQLIQEARCRKAKLILVFDPNRKWQRLSFDALRVFEKADGLFQVKPVGSS